MLGRESRRSDIPGEVTEGGRISEIIRIFGDSWPCERLLTGGGRRNHRREVDQSDPMVGEGRRVESRSWITSSGAAAQSRPKVVDSRVTRQQWLCNTLEQVAALLRGRSRSSVQPLPKCFFSGIGPDGKQVGKYINRDVLKILAFLSDRLKYHGDQADARRSEPKSHSILATVPALTRSLV